MPAQASLALAEAQDDVQLLHSLAPTAPRAAWAAALLATGGLRGLVQATDDTLAAHLPAAAIASMRAAFELNMRFRRSVDERPRLQTPQAIAEYLRPSLGHLAHERFVVLALSARNSLLGHFIVADGSVDQCNVDPRAVFAPVLSVNAASIVLAHNHPSGDAEPSTHDVAITHQLQTAGRALCMRLVDHVVIGARDTYVSFHARGLLR